MAQAVGNAATTAAAVGESYQPTVRVMRLYKPGLHLTAANPSLPECARDGAERVNFPATPAGFILSNFLLLPDSFGDIYAGEKFSAYIAVVNGFSNFSFRMVSLAVRLQTSSAVFDLRDIRPATGISQPSASVKQNGGVAIVNNLGFNETLDVIAQHTLTDLGTHTLRVTVQYYLPHSNEPKTLRKFYRFNVLQPLVVQSTAYLIDGLLSSMPMVQCQLTNATKAPIFIDELDFIPSSANSRVVKIDESTVKQKAAAAAAASTDSASDNNGGHKDALRDSFLAFDEESPLLLLNPEESYAFSFMFSTYEGGHVGLGGSSAGKIAAAGGNITLGHPEVKWCTSMGEYSVFRGDDTMVKIQLPAAIVNRSSSAAHSAISSTALVTSAKVVPSMPPSSSSPASVFGLSALRNSLIGAAASAASSANSASTPIVTICLECPGTASVGQEFEVVLRTLNFSTQPISCRVQCYQQSFGSGSSVEGSGGGGESSSSSSIGGLVFTGRTHRDLGVVEPGDFSDYTLTVYALTAGVHSLNGLCVLDLTRKKEYPAGALHKILVSGEPHGEGSADLDIALSALSVFN